MRPPRDAAAATAALPTAAPPTAAAPTPARPPTPEEPPPAGGRAPKPSAGCGKTPNTSTAPRTLDDRRPECAPTWFFSRPATTRTPPTPLGFAFNGFSRTFTQCANEGDCPGFKGLKAITVFPESFGQGWETPAVRPRLEHQVLRGPPRPGEERVLRGREPDLHRRRQLGRPVRRAPLLPVRRPASGPCRRSAPTWIAAWTSNCKGTPRPDRHPRRHRSAPETEARTSSISTPSGTAAPAPHPGSRQGQDGHDGGPNRSARRDPLPRLARLLRAPVRFCISSQITYDGLTHGWPRVGGMLIQDFLSTLK